MRKKELLQGIINLLIEHNFKNYKENSLLMRIFYAIILYPLKLWSMIIWESAASRFLIKTKIEERFDDICKKAIYYNLKRKGFNVK